MFSCRVFRCVATETFLFWLLVCYVVFNHSEHPDGLWFKSRESVRFGRLRSHTSAGGGGVGGAHRSTFGTPLRHVCFRQAKNWWSLIKRAGETRTSRRFGRRVSRGGRFTRVALERAIGCTQNTAGVRLMCSFMLCIGYCVS